MSVGGTGVPQKVVQAATEVGVSFGQRLRQLRREFDLSQAALGQKAGCSVNTVRKIESDERRPSRELSLRLASVFELPQRERAEFVRAARGTQHAQRATVPSTVTRLIGREAEVGIMRELLLSASVRLLTLVGPPGVGKTRLALEVASQLQDNFRDGAAYIPLAPIREPSVVLDTLAESLGVRGKSAESQRDGLVDFLRSRQLLLVLDNFEQVLPARELVSDLLARVSGVTVLVTSREALNVYGEHIYNVPTLGLPSRAGPRSSSETLFLERARALRPQFATSPADQSVVAQICVRLGGLPLAIELAASRARSMSPRVILDQLATRLDTLSGGPADFSARQRSMRGALDWSHELLSDVERSVFARFSIFSGGAIFDAIQHVCVESDIRAALDSLVEKSLLSVSEHAGASRYGMLEVIAEYASERLLSSESSADSHALRQRHAEFFANFAAEAPAGLRGPDQVRWLERLESEHDNFRAALEWTIANDEAELAGRLAAGVWPFWRARGYFHEGRRRLASVLALRDAMPLASLAAILNGSGVLAILQSDYAAATSFLEQALDLFRALENQRGVAFALSNLGWVAHDCADVDRAAALFEESLRIRRGLHDTWGQASSILNLGMIAISRNDPAEAARLFDESARLFRGIGDSVSLAQALTNAGWALHLVGDYTRATQLFSESLALAQRLQDARRIADNLSNLGLMALYRGDYASARDLYADSFTVFVELDDKRGMAESLEGRAAVAAVQGHAREAARQFGLAAAFRESVGALLLPGDRARYDSAIAVAREQLEDREWNQAWQEGAQGAMEEEIARLRVS